MLSIINTSLHEMWKDYDSIISLVSAFIFCIIVLLGTKSDPIFVAGVLIFVLLLFYAIFYVFFYIFKFVPIKVSNQEFIFNPQLTKGMGRFPSPVLLFNPKYKSHYKFSLELLDNAYKDLIKWKRYVLVIQKPRKTFEITPTGTQDSLKPIFHYNDNYCFLGQEFEEGGKKELNFSFEIGSNEDAEGKYAICIYLVKEFDYKEIFKDDFRDNFKAKRIHKEHAYKINIMHNQSKSLDDISDRLDKLLDRNTTKELNTLLDNNTEKI